MQQEIFDAISHGIIIINDKGEITVFNRPAEALLGIDAGMALGRPINEVLPSNGLTEVLATGKPQLNQKVIAGRFTLVINRTPLINDGKVVGAVALFEDISVKESMARELAMVRELKDDLEAIFNSSYDEIFVIDGQGTVTKVNKISETYYGVPTEEIVGKNVLDLEKEGFFRPSVTSMVFKEKRRLTIAQKTRSGKELIVTANPVFNQQGEITRVVVNSRDVTELTSLKQKLTETEKLAESYRTQIMQLQMEKLKSDEIIARSSHSRQLLEMVEKVAQVDSTVLITGESGVGKGIISAKIHKLSKRSPGPFVAINCGAIPVNLLESELFGYEPGAFTGAKKEGKKGLIQLGQGGTVFLDEIADLPLNLQVKLLHVIQQKSLTRVGGSKPVDVNVRFIAATNRDIKQMMKEGTFREDLFYRLNVIPLYIQPLRYRSEDILPLVEHFLSIYNGKYGINKKFAKETRDILEKYHWPGNVREVENIVERLMVTTESADILPIHLPDYIINSSDNMNNRVYVLDLCSLDEAIEEVERQLLQKAFERYDNTYRMAEALKVNQSTVVRKMKKYIPSAGGRPGGRRRKQ
ncbi:zinc sigma-54-dependent two-component system [Desulfocucumis palustris]|uniref:HTH-type transcriptional regulatory protein TyrR n=1 Tax=Desulfocucumis palustris TaxID=1898651 RepID=A0A2L2XGB4_9FIRM|nr:sigma 54-interacting transcriptional regulator [Desulfocucumis palustris]GBF35288.1 zinc sigma-54-dependent two-component system [Desulfocucumis palustris]